MATAAASAIAPVISAITGALSNQSRREVSGRSQTESALPVLAATEKKRLKRLEKQADKERLYNLLQQPEVLGLLMTLGGMLIANNIPFSSNKAENQALQSIGVTSSVLLGLGHAGVGDLTTLAIAAAAGGSSMISGIDGGGILSGGDGGFSWGKLAGYLSGNPGINLLGQFGLLD